MILDFLITYSWIIWIALILIFGIIELTTLEFTFLMLAIGSLGGLVSGLGKGEELAKLGEEVEGH